MNPDLGGEPLEWCGDTDDGGDFASAPFIFRKAHSTAFFIPNNPCHEEIPPCRFDNMITIHPKFFFSFDCPIKAMMTLQNQFLPFFPSPSTYWTEEIESTQKADAHKNDLWIIDHTLFSRAHFELKVRAKFHFLQNGISLCFKDTMCQHSLDTNDELLRKTFRKKHFIFSPRSVAWKTPTISLSLYLVAPFGRV